MAPSVPDTKLGKLFGIVCGFGVCSGIQRNATSGDYGAYSVCSPKEQLTHAFNRYYNEQTVKGNGDSACHFGGAATKKSPSKPKGMCAALLKEAGVNGTGQITSSDNFNTASGASGSSASEGSAQPLVTHDYAGFGRIAGIYILAALATIIGMIMA